MPRFDPASLPESVRRLNPHLAAKKKGAAAKPAASSRANGASWEGDVASALEALAAAGDVAHFLRQDARKVERDRRVVGRVPGACDFVGALGDGRAFCVECKGARSGAVYATREHAAAARRARAPAFTGEQRAQLDAYDRCGAAALVAVRLGGRRFLAPWRAVRGAQKLDASDLSAWAWDGGAPRLRERLAVDESGRVISDQISVGRPVAAVPIWSTTPHRDAGLVPGLREVPEGVSDSHGPRPER